MSLLAQITNPRSIQQQQAPSKSLQVDIQTAGLGEDDAEMFHLPGFYSIPIGSIMGILGDAGDNNVISGTIDYNFTKVLELGEAIMYCMNSSGIIQSSVYVNKDGDTVINEGTESAVSYSQLDTALQNLVIAINAQFLLISTEINNLGGNYPAPTLTIDISGSESDTVKIPL